jgi:hypothetical protein
VILTGLMGGGKSCQEKLVILTGLMGEGLKLSRKARDFDSFERNKGKAVKKSS